MCHGLYTLEDYKLYHAQSLYKASLYPEALKVSRNIKDDSFSYRVSNLQAAVAYQEDDTAACRAKLEECPSDDPDMIVNLGKGGCRLNKHISLTPC